MDHKHFQNLFDYNYWAHRKVWDCAMHLTDEQFSQQPSYSIGSIHQQFVHVMSAEFLWFSRLQGVSPTTLFSVDDFPTRDAVRSKWDEIEGDVRRYLSQLKSDDLMTVVSYQTTRGVPHQMAAIDLLAHVINHGTDHRAQILRILDDLGAPTVAQDMVTFLREQGRA